MARRCGFLVALLLAAGAHCAPARADGDPASDYLLEQQVFLPAQLSHTSSASQQQLLSAVRTANRRGFQIRVAVISSSYDLGSVTQLWRRPQTYARFLGIELSLSYKGRLLVVMPNGFGLNWPGHPVAGSERLLAHMPIRAGEAGELDGAAAAVARLATAAGVSVAPAPPAGSGGGFEWELVAGAALALALAVGWALMRRRATAAPGAAPAPGTTAALPPDGADDKSVPAAVGAPAWEAAAEPPPTGARKARPAAGARQRRRAAYALPVIALLVAAASVPVIASSAGRSASRTTKRQKAEGPEPAAAWPAGERPAPNFHLTDQNGHRVSLAAYRGRPVLITFVDPLCRNLCPLEAHVLNQMDRTLPASRRPAIIAVSVDLWANTRADLLQDYSKWGLVPQWRWAVGSPSQLESVWRRYAEEVDVETKRIAGTTVHYIGHDEMAYLIDPRGYERALFLWPFQPADVERTLRQL